MGTATAARLFWLGVGAVHILPLWRAVGSLLFTPVESNPANVIGLVLVIAFCIAKGCGWRLLPARMRYRRWIGVLSFIVVCGLVHKDLDYAKDGRHLALVTVATVGVGTAGVAAVQAARKRRRDAFAGLKGLSASFKTLLAAACRGVCDPETALRPAPVIGLGAVCARAPPRALL